MTDMNFASLSPTLLARKGGAKPAMRRQSIAIAGTLGQDSSYPASLPQSTLEDLGWNDLGDESAEAGMAAPANDPEDNSADDALAAKVTAIGTKAPRLPRPRLAASSEAPPQDKSTGRRTAFTLRLDPERHLKLRMASTLAGRSAQVLVTEAVDAMFADIPELNALVARVKSRPQKEG